MVILTFELRFEKSSGYHLDNVGSVYENSSNAWINEEIGNCDLREENHALQS